MSTKHTCIVRDQLYEAVDAETLDKLPDLVTACDLCAAKPLSELCDELDACCIDGIYHYWRLVEPEAEPEIVPMCAGCLYLNLCHADPLTPACPSYESSPGLSGCCSALLLVAGFAGLIGCACFAVFTH